MSKFSFSVVIGTAYFAFICNIVNSKLIRCSSRDNCKPKSERCLTNYCVPCNEFGAFCEIDSHCCDWNLNPRYYSGFAVCIIKRKQRKCALCKKISKYLKLLVIWLSYKMTRRCDGIEFNCNQNN